MSAPEVAERISDSSLGPRRKCKSASPSKGRHPQLKGQSMQRPGELRVAGWVQVRAKARQSFGLEAQLAGQEDWTPFLWK